MDLTDFFKVTKNQYTAKNVKRKEALSYEESRKKYKNEQNNLKYQKYTRNDSGGSSEDEIFQKQKQIKLDAFIKKISQTQKTNNESSVEHRETQNTVLKETYVNPTYFNHHSARKNARSTTETVLINKSNRKCTNKPEKTSFRHVLNDITSQYKYRDTETFSYGSNFDDKHFISKLPEYLNSTHTLTNLDKIGRNVQAYKISGSVNNDITNGDSKTFTYENNSDDNHFKSKLPECLNPNQKPINLDKIGSNARSEKTSGSVINDGYKYRDTETFSYESYSDHKYFRSKLPECLNYYQKNTNIAVYNKADCSKKERLSNFIYNIQKKKSGRDKTEGSRSTLTCLENLQGFNDRDSSIDSTECSFDFTDRERKINNKENECTQTKTFFVEKNQSDCTEQFAYKNNQNITRTPDILDTNLLNMRYSKEVDTSADSDATFLEYSSKSPPGLGKYQNTEIETKSENNNTENTGIDHDFLNIPEGVNEDFVSGVVKVSERPRSPEFPQIFSSKHFLEELSPDLDCTNHIDSLVESNIDKNEPQSCTIFNDEQIHGVFNKEHEKQSRKQEVITRSPEIPQIIPSKSYLKEVRSAFDCSNDIDSLVGSSVKKHEPQACLIFNDKEIFGILNKEYDKHSKKQQIITRYPESPQIIPSKSFLKEVSPVFDSTNDIDSLVGSSIKKHEPQACPIFNDEQIFGILNKEYEKHLKKQEVIANEASFSNMSRIEKLTQRIPSDRIKHSKTGKCFKRYKKGKTKIYRLKKMKKLPSKSTEKSNEFEIDDILKRMTQNYIYPESQFIESESCSSISTSSSYITDESKSEVSTDSRELSEPQQTLRKQLNKIIREEKMSSARETLNSSECEKKEIRRKIQDIFLRIYDDFSKGRSSYLKYRRQNFENCVFKDRRLQFKPPNECTTSVIRSTTKNSRFKLILYLMDKIQYLLETNTKITKRELYYQMKEMIKNQAIMYGAINVVSCILDSGMWALNIVAQKGLVYGELEILMSNGATLNCKVPGTSIPHDIGEIVQLQSTASFILVVEKEAIFHKLIEEELLKKLPKSFIMITGKGFPDLNTQLFLRKLWIVMAVPIFILVDADPHGVQIMLNYRFGSVHNAHVSQHLAVPNAKWLGIYPSEIKEFDIKTQPLTSKELKLIQQLLTTPYMDGNPEIAAELNVLLENNYKAGIEGLMKSQIFLSEVYLPTKFAGNKFIS